MGLKNFNISLDELKDFLSFKLSFGTKEFENSLDDKYDILLIHEDYLGGSGENLKTINKSNKIKILISNQKKKFQPNSFHARLSLPISIKELNETIENLVAKKNFNQNSFITIKNYILDKNEKKLKKDNNFIYLTEKEIQLFELFLKNNKSINKDQILKEVWGYAKDADTHTVETHIYRLRKKIKNEFSDDNFILNDKKGYSLWKEEIRSQWIFLQKNIENVLLNQKKEKGASGEKKNKLI